MKHKITFLWLCINMFLVGIFSIHAQDLIVLKDGNFIESKVVELSPTEIRYKRFKHLDGPTIVILASDVLSIRYENGMVEIIGKSSVFGQSNTQSKISQVQSSTQANISQGQENELTSLSQDGNASIRFDRLSALQNILNALPAIPIAGNNLKFDFNGESWVARVNGENFSTGSLEYEETKDGYFLTLRQTHIWPGAVGRTAGRVASLVPGSGAVGSVLNTAGNIAGAVGPIETSGTIVLEYMAGPPASLKLVSNSDKSSPKTIKTETEITNLNNRNNNWISFEFAFFGIGARYERMLGSNFSLGVNFYWGPPIIEDYYEISAFFRIYPWGKTFFLGAGFGYNWSPNYGYEYNDYYTSEYSYYERQFIIIPEIGWKIDVGQNGGFYLMPCITFPFTFGDFKFFRFTYFGMGFSF